MEVISDISPPLERKKSLDSPKSPTLLPWDRFSNWLHCVCVVTFDLELGQAMELIYPGHIKLTEKEKMNICYLSFPDSNSGCMGDTQFHFRIRQCPGRRIPNMVHDQYNRDCPLAMQLDNGHYYGYVYFRQTKDRSIRRGYFQKSVVLISRMPFVALFHQLICIIAPDYFDNGEPSLEAACHDMDQWPSPLPGHTLNLPVFGTVIQVRVPSRSDKVLGSSQLKSPPSPLVPAHKVLPSLHEVDQYSSLQSVIGHVQMLWELVLTNEAIVVMAASPSITSQTVEALISLISPLKFSCDHRPYFTIHDSEFREYTTRIQAPPPILLGVTNPFFAKTLQHWPHVIRIGEMHQHASPRHSKKVKKAGHLKTLDSKPGVYTQYKPFLSRDKAILKKLLKGAEMKRPVEVQNAILRRHFLELTQSFMIPLERYMASLMPLQRNISPHKGAPQLRPFDPDEFLGSLEQSGPQLTTGIKGDWYGLYRRFFRCRNFECWYCQRHHEVSQKLQLLHLEALCDANLLEWIQDKEEVEIVDLILRIRDKLTIATSQELPINEASIKSLQHHLTNIIARLPEDLQAVLQS